MVNYTYNSDGIRTSKTVNGVETTYQLDETKIVSETTNENIKWYIYDENNLIIGFEYNDQAYYFEKNAQGDVVRIFDSNGNFVSEYFYDAWGNIASVSGNQEIADANPFRYRGYYYDNESGLYYLQSRYYDSFTGRFLNADDTDFISTESTVLSNNLFTYCKNNPVNYVDPTGRWLLNVVCAVAGAALFSGVTYLIGKIFGISGKSLTIAMAALGVIGGTLAGIFGPKFLAKVAPELVKWFKKVQKNTKIFGPNKSGNIVGVVLFNKIKIMIHRPHKGKHNYYHIQIEARIGKKWKSIGRVPISGKK